MMRKSRGKCHCADDVHVEREFKFADEIRATYRFRELGLVSDQALVGDKITAESVATWGGFLEPDVDERSCSSPCGLYLLTFLVAVLRANPARHLDLKPQKSSERVLSVPSRCHRPGKSDWHGRYPP